MQGDLILYCGVYIFSILTAVVPLTYKTGNQLTCNMQKLLVAVDHV